MHIKIISVLIITTIACLLSAAELKAAATVERVTDVDDVAITSAAPGKTIKIRGFDFGRTQRNKNVTFFSGRPEEFYVDLEITGWSERGDAIVARIPSFSSNCYRATPGDLDERPLPDRIKSTLPQSGYLMITDLTGRTYEEFSNRVPFTLEPAPEVAMAITISRPLIAISLMSHPCCKALYAPPRISPPVTCYPGIPPVIDSIEPTSGPPGTYIDIKGNCFGVSPDDSSVIVRGEEDPLHNVSLQEIVSWSNNRIVARIPPPDSIQSLPSGRYIVYPYPLYERPEYIYSLNIHVAVDDEHSDPKNFDLTPYEPEKAPTLCSLSPTTVDAGSCFMIKGTEFGPNLPPGKVFIKKRGAAAWELTNALWTSATIRACVPRSILAGPYKIYISRPNERGLMINSNELNLDVTGVSLIPVFTR